MNWTEKILVRVRLFPNGSLGKLGWILWVDWPFSLWKACSLTQENRLAVLPSKNPQRRVYSGDHHFKTCSFLNSFVLLTFMQTAILFCILCLEEEHNVLFKTVHLRIQMIVTGVCNKLLTFCYWFCFANILRLWSVLPDKIVPVGSHWNWSENDEGKQIELYIFRQTQLKALVNRCVVESFNSLNGGKLIGF